MAIKGLQKNTTIQAIEHFLYGVLSTSKVLLA
jgi:hypothetical protein